MHVCFSLCAPIAQAKLETKALKAKRPGFTDERYHETSYYIENGKCPGTSSNILKRFARTNIPNTIEVFVLVWLPSLFWALYRSRASSAQRSGALEQKSNQTAGGGVHKVRGADHTPAIMCYAVHLSQHSGHSAPPIVHRGRKAVQINHDTKQHLLFFLCVCSLGSGQLAI